MLKVFAVPTNKPGAEPRLALLASGCLCLGAILIGSLDAVAPILTMFFLMCYTCVNLSCAVLELLDDPSWRPQFRRYHWLGSVLGMVLCVYMMFAISIPMAVAALLFCGLILGYAAKNSHAARWGDGLQGMKFMQYEYEQVNPPTREWNL